NTARNARYAMISPTRMPSCLSVLAASLSGLTTMAAPLAALYGTGCDSGFVTGEVGLGTLFGGGGVAGSFVGATGSSSGMTVYRLIGSPIRAPDAAPHAGPSAPTPPKHKAPPGATLP